MSFIAKQLGSEGQDATASKQTGSTTSSRPSSEAGSKHDGTRTRMATIQPGSSVRRARNQLLTHRSSSSNWVDESLAEGVDREQMRWNNAVW